MQKNTLVAPVLKWAGGKRQLLSVLTPLLPKNITTYTSYCEPFVGGGALFFTLQPKIAYINDINNELIRLYSVIKNDVEALITALQQCKNEATHFYQVRDWDRNKEQYALLSDVQKAARILYLNKTCYNGLFRVNNAGQFNAPFGKYCNPNIVNAPSLRAVSEYLNFANITFTSCDYTQVLQSLPKNTFVYLDPPYDPVSNTANFTGYAQGGFLRKDQIRLREWCDTLHKKGIHFMLSNAATDFIKEQYSAYNITIVQAKRAINAHGAKRGEVDEVVVRNYA